MDVDSNQFGVYPIPSTSQLSGMPSFDAVNVVAESTTSRDSSDYTYASYTNKVGMYQSETDNNSTFENVFWLQYQAYFSSSNGVDDTANESTDNWCEFSQDQSNMTWRILFQMGDEFSDWEGLEYTFDGTAIYVDDTDFYADLEKTTVSDSRIYDDVDAYNVSGGSFFGTVSHKKSFNGLSGETNLCAFTFMRITTDQELTTDDGEVVRIEAGRDLRVVSWDNNGNIWPFEITLEGAWSALQAGSVTSLLVAGLL